MKHALLVAFSCVVTVGAAPAAAPYKDLPQAPANGTCWGPKYAKQWAERAASSYIADVWSASMNGGMANCPGHPVGAPIYRWPLCSGEQFNDLAWQAADAAMKEGDAWARKKGLKPVSWPSSCKPRPRPMPQIAASDDLFGPLPVAPAAVGQSSRSFNINDSRSLACVSMREPTYVQLGSLTLRQCRDALLAHYWKRYGGCPSRYSSYLGRWGAAYINIQGTGRFRGSMDVKDLGIPINYATPTYPDVIGGDIAACRNVGTPPTAAELARAKAEREAEEARRRQPPAYAPNPILPQRDVYRCSVLNEPSYC